MPPKPALNTTKRTRDITSGASSSSSSSSSSPSSSSNANLTESSQTSTAPPPASLSAGARHVHTPVRTLGSTSSRIAQLTSAQASAPRTADVTRKGTARLKFGPVKKSREAPSEVDMKDVKPTSAQLSKSITPGNQPGGAGSGSGSGADTGAKPNDTKSQGRFGRRNDDMEIDLYGNGPDANVLPVYRVSEEQDMAPVSLPRDPVSVMLEQRDTAIVGEHVEDLEAEKNKIKSEIDIEQSGDYYQFGLDPSTLPANTIPIIDGEMMIMQFPPSFPRLEVENKMDQDVSNLDVRYPYSDGQMGELLVHESGKVSISIPGDVPFDMLPLTNASCLQEVVFIDDEDECMTTLGQVSQKVAITPNIEALFNMVQM